MLISQLPPDLRALAELRRKEQPDFASKQDDTDDLWYAFSWTDAPERTEFWGHVYVNGQAPQETPAPFPETLIRAAVRMTRGSNPNGTGFYTEDEIVNELKKKV